MLFERIKNKKSLVKEKKKKISFLGNNMFKLILLKEEYNFIQIYLKNFLFLFDFRNL